MTYLVSLFFIKIVFFYLYKLTVYRPSLLKLRNIIVYEHNIVTCEMNESYLGTTMTLTKD